MAGGAEGIAQLYTCCRGVDGFAFSGGPVALPEKCKVSFSFLHPRYVLRMQPDPWLAVPSAHSLENPEGRLLWSSSLSLQQQQQHPGSCSGSSHSSGLVSTSCTRVGWAGVTPACCLSISREHLHGKDPSLTSSHSLSAIFTLAKAQFLSWPHPSQLWSGICRAVIASDFPKLVYKVRSQSGSRELHLLFCKVTPMLAEPYTSQLRHSQSVGLLYPYVHPYFNQLTSLPSM